MLVYCELQSVVLTLETEVVKTSSYFPSVLELSIISHDFHQQWESGEKRLEYISMITGNTEYHVTHSKATEQLVNSL